uniref:MsrB domain-containing protein n=1 Tax=Alexandrium monilatum TaxID=311494 RepID=A0A7S4PSI7_9DINO|mmetsp:Transcript_7187/g.23015  ORF Transcript_7187/g.23015 Transcript_7187/m.23015 type:complete len:218 (+) Transcript_7187:186-839(+)
MRAGLGPQPGEFAPAGRQGAGGSCWGRRRRQGASGPRQGVQASGEAPWPTHPLEDEEWEQLLSPARYSVLRDKVTEPRGSGEYDKFFPGEGHFRCAGCDTPLYSAAAKMQGGCGWPAFGRCYAGANERARVVAQVDWVAGGREILCRRCGGHLGHVFMDGNPERHCVNSLSITYSEGPPTTEGGSELPAEVLTDMSTFHRQLKEHSRNGSYDGVIDP